MARGIFASMTSSNQVGTPPVTNETTTAKSLCVVFDSNAIDPIADTPGAYEAVRQAVDEHRVEILYTHINIDELAAITDLERRSWLLLLLVDLGSLVPTGGAAVEFSRVNFCRVLSEQDADIMEALRSGNIVHTRDALIAATSRFERAGLVTNEKRLASRARTFDIEVLTTHELLDRLGFNRNRDKATTLSDGG